MAVKYRGSKSANKPIKSRIMLDDNFEKQCPIITEKAKKSDIWDYIFIAMAAIGVALIANGIYLYFQ